MTAVQLSSFSRWTHIRIGVDVFNLLRTWAKYGPVIYAWCSLQSQNPTGVHELFTRRHRRAACCTNSSCFLGVCTMGPVSSCHLCKVKRPRIAASNVAPKYLGIALCCILFLPLLARIVIKWNVRRSCFMTCNYVNQSRLPPIFFCCNQMDMSWRSLEAKYLFNVFFPEQDALAPRT